MSNILVTSPYRPFTLPNQFKAVFNGYIYCGTVDAVDPSVSQVQVYLVNESGNKVPVAQPLRTNAGGFLVYNGQPAKFVTDSNHSLLIRDSLQMQIWYEPDMAAIDPDVAFSVIGVLAREALRRTHAESGYELVAGSFESGGTVTTATDVLLFEAEGKAYSWGGALPKIVPVGSTPAGTGGISPTAWTDQSHAPNYFIQNGSGAVRRVAMDKMREIVSITDFGANGDGVTDNADVLDLIAVKAVSGVPFRIPKGTYATSRKFTLTDDFSIIADRGARIKYIGDPVIDTLIDIDFTGGLPGGFAHGGDLRNLVIDGNGKATDGITLRGVVSGVFKAIRTTNVTRAGMRLAWAQLCLFENYECSNNIEVFTTTPVNGILADTASSSANTFINPTIEHVSGQGLLGKSIINSVFINGTIEGNNIGVELGETVVGSLTSIGNTFIGCDMEVNTVSDIVLLRTASSNDFISVKAGFESGAVLIQHSSRNRFIGGITGGVDMDANSSDNYIDGTSFIGAGRSVTDAGTNNSWRGLYNITTATRINDKGTGRANNVLSAGQTALIDASMSTYHVASCTGSTATIGNPIKGADGQDLEICVHNISGGALTVTWGSSYKMAGWVNPSNGFNRTARFRFDTNFDGWYLVSVTANDVPN